MQFLGFYTLNTNKCIWARVLWLAARAQAITHLRKEGSTAMLDRYAASSGGCRVLNSSLVSRWNESPAVPTSLNSLPAGKREGSAGRYPLRLWRDFTEAFHWDTL